MDDFFHGELGLRGSLILRSPESFIETTPSQANQPGFAAVDTRTARTPERTFMTFVRPLTPFEHLMLMDMRRGYPMCFFLEMRLVGSLHRQQFAAAVLSASARHPQTQMRVGYIRGRPVWLAPDQTPTVEWVDEATAAPTVLWRPIDLGRESGVRFIVIAEPSLRWRVVLQVHHSVCDGLAAVEYFGDLWACYSAATPAAFRFPTRPARRAQAPTAPVAAGSHLTHESLAFARFFPEKLARPATTTAAVDASLSNLLRTPYETFEFSSALSLALRNAASRASVTLNDVAIAAVMRALLAWNVAAGHPAKRIRVNMPVSLRSPGARGPACNNMGYAFLDRTSDDCTPFCRLTLSIATASRWIQSNRAAEWFLDTLAVLSTRPWLLWLITRLPICLSTAVVSNLGNVTRRLRAHAHPPGHADPYAQPMADGKQVPDQWNVAADLQVTGMWGVPPIRPGTRAAVGVTTYGGRLHIAVLCDTQSLGPNAAAAMALMIQDALQHAAGGLACEDPPADLPHNA